MVTALPTTNTASMTIVPMRPFSQKDLHRTQHGEYGRGEPDGDIDAKHPLIRQVLSRGGRDAGAMRARDPQKG